MRRILPNNRNGMNQIMSQSWKEWRHVSVILLLLISSILHFCDPVYAFHYLSSRTAVSIIDTTTPRTSLVYATTSTTSSSKTECRTKNKRKSFPFTKYPNYIIISPFQQYYSPQSITTSVLYMNKNFDNDNNNKNNKLSNNGKYDGNKFGFIERIDSIKSFIIGAIVGGIALTPFSAIHELLLPTISNVNGLGQFEFDVDMGSIQAGLFSIIYRYCIREDNNIQLNQGIIGGFIVIRTLSRIIVPSYCTPIPLSCGDPLNYFDYNMIYQLILNGLESVALFGVTAYAIDWTIQKKWISKFPG